MSKKHDHLLELEGNELNMRIRGKNKVNKHINKYKNKQNLKFKLRLHEQLN